MKGKKKRKNVVHKRIRTGGRQPGECNRERWKMRSEGEGESEMFLTEVGSERVHGDIMADCEESIDRRAIHLSLDTYVGG